MLKTKNPFSEFNTTQYEGQRIMFRINAKRIHLGEDVLNNLFNKLAINSGVHKNERKTQVLNLTCQNQAKKGSVINERNYFQNEKKSISDNKENQNRQSFKSEFLRNASKPHVFKLSSDSIERTREIKEDQKQFKPFSTQQNKETVNKGLLNQNSVIHFNNQNPLYKYPAPRKPRNLQKKTEDNNHTNIFNQSFNVSRPSEPQFRTDSIDRKREIKICEEINLKKEDLNHSSYSFKNSSSSSNLIRKPSNEIVKSSNKRNDTPMTKERPFDYLNHSFTNNQGKIKAQPAEFHFKTTERSNSKCLPENQEDKSMKNSTNIKSCNNIVRNLSTKPLPNLHKL